MRPALNNIRVPRPARPALAIDFGAASTTVAVATRFGRGARVKELLTIGPGPGELAALVARRHWQGVAVRVVVQEGDLLWRQVPVPQLSRRMTTSLLTLEVGKQVAGGLDRFHWGYRPTTGSGGNRSAAVGAATREHLEDLAGRLKAAGLCPAGFIPLPEAVRPLLPAESGSGQGAAVIDFGATRTRVVLLNDSEAILFRQVSVGGDHLTAELQSIVVPGKPALAFEPAAAEDLKCRHGLSHEPGSGTCEGLLPLGQVTATLRPILERLVRELYSAFDYWNERYSGVPMAEVRLIGGGALLPGLPEYLEAVLGLPVLLAGAPAGVPEDAPDLPGGALAAGAALAGPRPIDLSEPAPPGDLEMVERWLDWKAVAAILALYAGVGGGLGALRSSQMTSRAGAWQSRLAGMETRASILRTAAEADACRLRNAEIRRALATGTPDWPVILAGLSRQMGEQARLTELSLETAGGPDGQPAPPTLNLAGRVTGQDPPSEVVAQLLVSLGSVPGLGSAELVESAEDDAGNNRFLVRSSLRPGGQP